MLACVDGGHGPATYRLYEEAAADGMRWKALSRTARSVLTGRLPPEAEALRGRRGGNNPIRRLGLLVRWRLGESGGGLSGGESGGGFSGGSNGPLSAPVAPAEVSPQSPRQRQFAFFADSFASLTHRLGVVRSAVAVPTSSHSATALSFLFRPKRFTLHLICALAWRFASWFCATSVLNGQQYSPQLTSPLLIWCCAYFSSSFFTCDCLVEAQSTNLPVALSVDSCRWRRSLPTTSAPPAAPSSSSTAS